MTPEYRPSCPHPVGRICGHLTAGTDITRYRADVASDDVVRAARTALGPVGVLLPVSFTSTPTADQQRDAVGRLERAGARTAWTNEVVGKDALVQLGVLLAATRRLTFGTGIANVWARPPQTLHAAAATLADAYPGRLVLGIGGGYPQQAASVGREFGRPLTTMRDYLDGMDAPGAPPAPPGAYPRLIAANGPKMLALAAERADGALPAGLPPAFTAQARAALGPDKLLVVGMTTIPDDDPERARSVAGAAVAASSGMEWYARTLARLGYTEQQITDADPALVDDVVAHGDAARIAAAARAHLAAGADHVVVQLQMGRDYAEAVEVLEALVPALTEDGC